MTETLAKLRIDKWLWHARFYKTRSLAARQVSDGRVRLNGERIHKPATGVTAGDVLTFVQGRLVRVVRVLELGQRRGPAEEARNLYQDVPQEQDKMPANPKFEGKGRPTKRDRRSLDLSRPGSG
ncbi:MAG: RNA-binding S4 domain-containing protein [Pseudomonadota bacterium]